MPDDRPNIIFIITDQQRFDTINALGFPYMETPNLDRLVNEGVSFSRCFITAPSCAPARASLFTGYYPHTTRIFKNGDPWAHSWVERLSEAGYHCVNVGKMHTTPFEAPAGFHERYIVENKDRYLQGRWYFDAWDRALGAQGVVKPHREIYRQRDDYREVMGSFLWSAPDHLHPDNFVGDTALWWLGTYPQTQPLFLQIGFPGPHPPYDPVQEYAERYLDKDLPLLDVTDEEIDGLPDVFKSMREHCAEVDHDSVVHLLDPTPEQRHRQRAYYLANVTMIDEKIGQILETLGRKGYLDNAVVIFTSDHGDCLTDHGATQKWTMYDTITRVPTIVWAPGRFDGGRSVDEMYQWMDLGPTILELAEVDIPRSFEARSMLPALTEGSSANAREYVFSEHAREDSQGLQTDFMTMVRSRDWKLVHFLGEAYGQLFDMNADPDEVNNLWDDPGQQDRKRDMLDVLRDWLIHSHHHTTDWGAEWR